MRKQILLKSENSDLHVYLWSNQKAKRLVCMSLQSNLGFHCYMSYIFKNLCRLMQTSDSGRYS